MPHKKSKDRARYEREYRLKRLRDWVEYLDSVGMAKCSLCGYSKCFAAIEFHHMDPAEKSAHVSALFKKLRVNPANINRIMKEVNKCLVLCANCHREIHVNINEEKYAEEDKNGSKS